VRIGLLPVGRRRTGQLVRSARPARRNVFPGIGKHFFGNRLAILFREISKRPGRFKAVSAAD
jgi:hypothetical protein